uniref:Secreted protein n=1 Tax=Ascaris lumbricoides TaxID=6252 RepID=A0A0M3I4R7_ASCLU
MFWLNVIGRLTVILHAIHLALAYNKLLIQAQVCNGEDGSHQRCLERNAQFVKGFTQSSQKTPSDNRG